MPALPSSLRFSTGCELDLLTDGDRWRGIGGVRVDGTTLRDPRLPILPEIRSTEAVELTDWRVIGTSPLADGGLAVELEPSRREGGIMEWMLHRVHNRYRVSDWTQQPTPASDTRLTIELRPATRTVRGSDGRGVEGRGFSYRFLYRSTSIPIYKILDRATWEPGGTALGSQFWMRNTTSPSIAHIPVDGVQQHYSTEWWMGGCHNPSIFQFVPLQTQLCGFSLTATAAGALVTWVDGVAHVRSLFEKPRGWTSLLHLHEHCGDLANEFTTKPVEVLWFPGARDHVANANLWESVRELVYGRLHAEAGIREERIDVYAVLEEWGMPDFERYTREAVPALLSCGVKQLYIPNQFSNNMNTWGASNFCCTVDYQIAESIDAKAVRRFCDAVHAGGAVVHHWGNTALSTYTWLNANTQQDAHQGRIKHLPVKDSVTEVIKAAKQPFVRNMAAHIEMDHYSPVFCQLNMRDPQIAAYWHMRWKAAHDDLGFDGIFLDSSCNMTSDKFHWIGQVAGSGGATMDQMQHLGQVRPAIEPPKAILSQYHAHLELVVEMQRYGYQYCGEDIGVFGTHRSGPEIRSRLDNLFMWNECIAHWDPKALGEAGVDPLDIFFKGLAYRCMWTLYWHIATGCLSWNYEGRRDDRDRPTEEQIAWLKAFSAATDDMRGRTILPGETGALFSGGKRRILWAFRDLSLPLAAGEQVVELVSGQPVAVSGGVLAAQARRVYAIAPRS